MVIIVAFSKREKNINQYDKAIEYIDLKNYDRAIDILRELKYEDSEKLIIYSQAKILMANGEYEGAIDKLRKIEDFRDSGEQIKYAEFNLAIQYFENNDYDEAKQLFSVC